MTSKGKPSTPMGQIPDFRGPLDNGSKYLYQRYHRQRTEYNPDGSVFNVQDFTTPDCALLFSMKGPRTVKPLKVIPGTSTKWRDASTYERSSYAIVGIEEGQYTFTHALGYVRYIDKYFTPDSVSFASYEDNLTDWWVSSHLGVTLGEISNTNARLITECLLELKGQKANLGEALATARQTADLFAASSRRFFMSLMAARRGRWREAFGVLGLRTRGEPVGLGVAQRYLEYTYGIRPLVQDIYGLYELLIEQVKPAMLLKAKRSLTETRSREYAKEDFGRALKHTYVEEHKRVDRIQIVARLDDTSLRMISQAGLSNPLSLAWDLMPWSFLIDWGLPIGNVLAALDAHHGLTFVDGFQSRVGRATYSRSSRAYLPRWKTDKEWKMAKFRFSFVRKSLPGFPRPVIYAKNPFSTGHVLNALALFRQLR